MIIFKSFNKWSLISYSRHSEPPLKLSSGIYGIFKYLDFNLFSIEIAFSPSFIFGSTTNLVEMDGLLKLRLLSTLFKNAVNFVQNLMPFVVSWAMFI